MEFLIAFVVFIVVVLFMALGVIFSQKRLQGSCGGLAAIDIERSCDCVDVCDEHQQLYQIQEPNSSKIEDSEQSR